MMNRYDKVVNLHNDWTNIPLKKENKIYHYTSKYGLDGIFSNQQLWANDVYRQNDMSEGVYILELLQKNIDVLCDDEVVKMLILKQVTELSPELIERFYNSDKYRSFIISFSTKQDELALWNYYTKNANSVGYNIEFNVERLTSNLKTKKLKKESDHITQYFDKLKCVHGKIVYDEKEQINIIKQIIMDFCKVTDIRDDEWAYLLVDKLLWVGFFMKHYGFRHEYEYRLAFFTLTDKSKMDIDKVPVEFEGINKNHIEIYFDGLAVNSVNCSPTNSKENNEYLKRYMTSQYPNLSKISESQIPFRNI